MLLLNLNFNPIADRGVRALAKSTLKELASLGLAHAGIRERGYAELIAESPHFNILRSLNLNGNDIGPDGILAILNSVNFKCLERLGLGLWKFHACAGCAFLLEERIFPSSKTASFWRPRE